MHGARGQLRSRGTLSITCHYRLGVPPIRGTPIYRNWESSLDFIPAPDNDFSVRIGESGPASILLNYVELGFGVDTGLATFVRGLCPVENWEIVEGPPPVTRPGGVWFDGLDLREGEGYGWNDDGPPWRPRFGVESNWLSIVDPERGPGTLVEIATGTAIGSDAGALTSLWVRPRFVRTPAEEDELWRLRPHM